MFITLRDSCIINEVFISLRDLWERCLSDIKTLLIMHEQQIFNTSVSQVEARSANAHAEKHAQEAQVEI